MTKSKKRKKRISPEKLEKAVQETLAERPDLAGQEAEVEAELIALLEENDE